MAPTFSHYWLFMTIWSNELHLQQTWHCIFLPKFFDFTNRRIKAKVSNKGFKQTPIPFQFPFCKVRLMMPCHVSDKSLWGAVTSNTPFEGPWRHALCPVDPTRDIFYLAGIQRRGKIDTCLLYNHVCCVCYDHHHDTNTFYEEHPIITYALTKI